ncbi:orotate phosphoribosyltransferase [Terribacillus saccharophilus]|uniref:Orotate phosphoribosyltransferase n=1 Tax=Terribacillus saccharophilus TaxID=361277 RepID=A0ABX4H2Q1_9BACI|nr:orotate phosphoribosyltransferase [Terribacillus saccharophilus]PAD37269.1 orotate phosphoribosyltransferase [Terribacillus saccharophilus]PAD97365.1 orotate phosphoribosyltransferase [Terribacillus saccharophilus]PAE01413.1 orotate phosphoribosyltransferase [Terribacillus saccharophilus]
MTTTTNIAEALLSIDAIQIDPAKSFVWASGIHSPIYCDNRLTLGHPEVRTAIARQFQKKLAELPETDIIAGCATGGIPHAAWLADKADLPMIYVRSSKKGHGKGNQIEGADVSGKHVVVIEDLISTGGSVINTIQALQEAGAIVTKVLAIFSYNLKKADDNFAAIDVPFETLTNFDSLVDILVEKETITSQEKQELLDWRNTL